LNYLSETYLFDSFLDNISKKIIVLLCKTNENQLKTLKKLKKLKN